MSDKVRFQVQVDKGLADHIAKLAEAFDRSQSWMTAEMLRVGIECRNQIQLWIVGRITGCIVKTLSGDIPHTGEMVYLQTYLTKDELQELQMLSERLKHSTSKMSALLLESIALDHGWMIKTIGASQRAMRSLKDKGLFISKDSDEKAA